jgi:hypothetical protein
MIECEALDASNDWHWKSLKAHANCLHYSELRYSAVGGLAQGWHCFASRSSCSLIGWISNYAA